MKLHQKSLFLLTLGLTCSSVAFSQTSTPIGAAAQQNVRQLGAGVTAQSFDDRYQGVKGSPYFLDVWVPGQVEVQVGNTGKTETFQNIRLKYDSFSNIILAVMPQTRDTVQLSPGHIKSFVMQDPVTGGNLLFKKFKEAQAIDPNLADAFFTVIYGENNAKSTLVKRIAKKKIEANFKGPYSAGQTFDEIVSEPQYYVIADGGMQKVKLNKKSLQDAFPARAGKIKSFISSQKLSMNTEEDLIKVMAYIDTQ